MDHLVEPVVDQFLECALRYQKDKPPARLYGDQLWFKGVSVNFGSKRQILQIVKILYHTQNEPLSLHQLMMKLGQVNDFDFCSKRLQKTYRQKIQKLLQRARRFLSESFLEAGLNYEWLPYNHKLGTWKLYGRPNPPDQDSPSLDPQESDGSTQAATNQGRSHY